MSLTILYRGPLSSCNYECTYCPFAKRHETATELAVDRTALARFADRVADWTDGELAIFFTPWGEALTRPWYRETVTRFTRLPHVTKVAVQTNLSWRTDWLDDCDATKLGLWCTYHPSQIDRPTFLRQCDDLRRRGVPFSVGMVGLHEDFGEIEALRADLDADVPLWVNAFKSGPRPYTDAEITRIEAVDPTFRTNTTYHASLGRACRTGEAVVSVDGDGTVRRCHFVPEPIGNLYDAGFVDCLRPRPCPNDTCGCHIGYVHLEHLALDTVYGDGMLERIPADPQHPPPVGVHD